MYDLINIGYIIKTIGYQGEALISCRIESDWKALFIEIDHKCVPFFIHSYKNRNEGAVVKFKEFDSDNKVSKFIGKQVFVENKYASNIEEEENPYANLIGFILFDKSKGEIGPIKDIIENKDQVLIELEDEVLIPLHEDFIVDLDGEGQTITLDLPEGILDL